MLGEVLTQHRDDERVRALRAILMQPLLTAAAPEFVLLRRHADELRLFLSREAGWVLHLERDCARLFKRPADLTDATRGASGFDRRRYALLCLAAAVLERSEAQISLRHLGEELVQLAADPALAEAGFRFALDQLQERRDLVHVCRFLIDTGVLARVAGEEDAYIAQSGDVLYDVQRRVLAALLACTRGPSTYAAGSEPADTNARLVALVEEFVADTPEARRTALRQRLARRLLDDPVVYIDELSADERDYFSNQRGPLTRRLCDATGLLAEQRAEGSALIDPDGELSDARLPAEGTLAHATLLLASYLAEQARIDAGRWIGEAEIATFLRKAADEFGKYWRKAEREPGAEVALARQAVAQLQALRLVSREGNAARALPALARFKPGTPVVTQGSLLA
jgi:uncharacterized protein (TIGR02678 family)